MSDKLDNRQTLADCKENIRHAVALALDADVLPETIEAITDFVIGMCRVSNKRPEKYRHETWLSLSAEEHARHAKNHAEKAWMGVDKNNSRSAPGWLDSEGDDQPNLYHAGLRAAFACCLAEGPT